NLIGINQADEDLGMRYGIYVSDSVGLNSRIISNTIAHNFDGIYIAGAGDFIHRNQIRNNANGIRFIGYGHGRVGSSDIADANVIGHNGTGISVSFDVINPVTIINNYIGTNASGASL